MEWWKQPILCNKLNILLICICSYFCAHCMYFILITDEEKYEYNPKNQTDNDIMRHKKLVLDFNDFVSLKKGDYVDVCIVEEATNNMEWKKLEIKEKTHYFSLDFINGISINYNMCAKVGTYTNQ